MSEETPISSPLKDDDNEKKRTKRVRTTTVSQACNNCREKHLKCDGVFPICTRCQTKSLSVCHYKATRLKRGPVPGTKSSKKGDTADPTLPKHQVRVSPIFEMIDTSSRFESMPFSSVAVEYLEFYDGYISPNTGVKPLSSAVVHSLLIFDDPDTKVDIRSGLKSEELSLAIQALVQLTHGAMMIGRKEHSEKCYYVVQQHLSELSKTTTLINAITYHILGWCFFTMADLPRGSNFNATAITMLQTLQRQCNTKASRYQVSTLLGSAVLHSAEYARNKEDQLLIYNEVMNIVSKEEIPDDLDKSIPLDTLTLCSAFLKITSIVHKVWTEVTCQVRNGKDINEYMKWLQDAEALIPPNINNLLKKDIQGLLTACCGGVLHILNLHELARKCADEVLETLDDIAYFYSPVVMLSLTMVVQVHYYEGKFEKVNQGSLIFKQIAKHYPIAMLLYRDMFEPLMHLIQNPSQHNGGILSPHFLPSSSSSSHLTKRRMDLYPHLPISSNGSQISQPSQTPQITPKFEMPSHIPEQSFTPNPSPNNFVQSHQPQMSLPLQTAAFYNAWQAGMYGPSYVAPNWGFTEGINLSVQNVPQNQITIENSSQQPNKN